MPASQPQAMTDVAKPVMAVAACIAHSGVSRGDHEPRRLHAEGFGEGIVDGDAVDDHERSLLRQG